MSMFEICISSICRKSNNIINQLFKIFRLKAFSFMSLDSSTNTLSYHSYFLPILENCSTIRSPYIRANKYLALIDKLESVRRYFTSELLYRRGFLFNQSAKYVDRLMLFKMNPIELIKINSYHFTIYKLSR